MRLTAQQIYEKLLNEDNILSLEGQIRFYLGDVAIIVRQKDVVGNIMQEWLQGWLEAKEIEFAPSENSQMPPDFFLNPDDKTQNLLEVKAFNKNGSPGFDIADFRMYAEEIQEKPYMLDVDYLIFGYDMSDDGIVTIKEMWLKKVWQITRRMKDHALNFQIKDGVIHKIRPGVWYSDNSIDYAVFESLEDFISALDDSVYREPRLRDTIATTWLSKFQRNYKKIYGRELEVPRWTDIKDKYDIVGLRKKEKALANLERANAQVARAKERVLKYEEKYKGVKTIKQKENASEQLQKAKVALDKAEEKRDKCMHDVEQFTVILDWD